MLDRISTIRLAVGADGGALRAAFAGRARLRPRSRRVRGDRRQHRSRSTCRRNRAAPYHARRASLGATSCCGCPVSCARDAGAEPSATDLADGFALDRLLPLAPRCSSRAAWRCPTHAQASSTPSPMPACGSVRSRRQGNGRPRGRPRQTKRQFRYCDRRGLIANGGCAHGGSHAPSGSGRTGGNGRSRNGRKSSQPC